MLEGFLNLGCEPRYSSMKFGRDTDRGCLPGFPAARTLVVEDDGSQRT
jgi:hypothetical protein